MRVDAAFGVIFPFRVLVYFGFDIPSDVRFIIRCWVYRWAHVALSVIFPFRALVYVECNISFDV